MSEPLTPEREAEIAEITDSAEGWGAVFDALLDLREALDVERVSRREAAKERREAADRLRRMHNARNYWHERAVAAEQRVADLEAELDAVGLPRTASVADLIRHHRANAGLAAALGRATDTAECISCDEFRPTGVCSQSKRACGHHCNHSWSHDSCCWCGRATDTETAGKE